MDIPDCMTTEEIRMVILDNEHLGITSEHLYCSWPSTKAKVQIELQLYWLFRDEMKIVDVNAMKGKRVLVSTPTQGKAVKHLHLNHKNNLFKEGRCQTVLEWQRTKSERLFRQQKQKERGKENDHSNTKNEDGCSKEDPSTT